jgi:hypothetical protein
MNKSLFDALNIAAQELFGQLEGTGDDDFDSTFVDELQQLNNWRKSILEFSHNLTQILEQYHSIDTATNNDNIRSLIENISKFSSISTKESDKRIIIRHRGLSPSIKDAGQAFLLNNDYVISVGDCVMDNQQLDYLVRFGIIDAGELREKLKKTFDFLQSQNIYIIDIFYGNWDIKDQQAVHDALLSWGQYFTALKKGFGVVQDGTRKPDPNLMILAVLNKLNLEKFQGTVDKVHKLMIQEKFHKKFNDVNSIYDAIFLIDELKSKLFRSPIEINNNKFIQIWRHCFDKSGKFNRIKFNQHRNRFLDWENAFYMFWADLKSVVIAEDRETILNCIIRFIADSKSHNEYVDYILNDFYSYPLHLQFSDRDSLFVANLLLFKDYVNRTYDFGHTPGEVLFSNELLNEETVRQLRLKITDKWKDKFLQKHRTIKKDLKLAMKANAQQDNVMPIQLLINILRELFIFLTIVWDKEFKSIVRDTVKEYANHQSELYHSENNPEVLLPLLQFFQITILCLVKLGDESDVDLLNAIRNREKAFLSMKGLLPKDYATHKKLISKIMSVVDDGVKTLKRIPESESNS